MTTKSTSVPEALNQHLSTNSAGDLTSLTQYLDRGAELVTPEAIKALRRMRTQLEKKVAGLGDSERLRRRIEVLAVYLDEAGVEAPADPQAQREVAFALLYFLKGFDRIPDTVPEIGLLDDAMIVQTVLQRHATVLQAHWQRQGRTWPADL